MFVEAYRDKGFCNVIHDADIITPDGMPLTWGMRLLYGIQQDRVAGSDILPDLLQQCEASGLSVFFYGGSKKLLDGTSDFLKNKYPDLKVAGLYSPPFRELSENETQDAISAINDSNANIVMVVLGCPKQEKWMHAMKGKINSIMIGIGGALPLLIGAQKRAPKWMQDYGLEWLFRLSIEPRRLFKRYAITNPYFIFIVFREFLRIKLLKKTA